jgi:hypothetical protein
MVTNRKLDRKEFTYWVAVTVIGNLISTSILGLVAIAAVDYFYSTPRLDGFWEVEATIEESSLKRYEGLKIVSQIAVTQENLVLSGSGDKLKEKTVGQDDWFFLDGKSRGQIKLNGYIEKNLLSKNEVIISTLEEGAVRTTTAFQSLKINNSQSMSGSFQSTAANSRGSVKWTKISSSQLSGDDE